MGSGSGRVEGYFEGYAIACVHFIEDLNRVEGSHDGHDLHALSNLELKPLYAAIFLALSKISMTGSFMVSLGSFIDSFHIFSTVSFVWICCEGAHHFFSFLIHCTLSLFA